jgi:hypothetical protein
MFEEKVLDDDCAKNSMGWEEYINRVFKGWTPDTITHLSYDIEAWRQAIKLLHRSEKKHWPLI